LTTDELQIQITADTGNASQNINETANALNKLDNSAKTADDGMSQLVKAMSDAALNMVSVSQNIAQSAAGMSDYKASFDNLSATLTNFSARLESVNALTAGTSFDGAAASVQALSAASESSAAALSGIVTATDGFNERMDALSDTTHGTTTGMVNLQKEIVSAVAEIRGFADNLGTAGQDAATTSQRIRELSEDVEKLVNSSQAGGAAAVSLAAGFSKLKGIIATLGVGKFIKDSNDAYNVQMQNELKLTAHMKHRMNATDDEIQSIKDLASAQQKIGVIGDEIQLAGAQQLTTYAKQSSTLKTLIPAMNNLIAQNAGYDATAGDATSAADMLGRALNGQYTSLRHMGVMFSEAQKNVLKYGTEEQKAAVLADAINSRVGNMNELLSQTPTGQLKQLQNDFGDLQEELGATWQMLVSSWVPVIGNVVKAVAPPVIMVARGISAIGTVIAELDSPVTRAIGLTIAGMVAMRKLSLVIGATNAKLLLLGVIVTAILGALSSQETSIAGDVEDAYASAEQGTENATKSAKDYEKEINNVQKAVNRLAGFDTITKLSGNTSGSLTQSLLGDTDISDFAEFGQDAANAFKAPFDDIKSEGLFPDFGELWSKISSLWGPALKEAQDFTYDLIDVFAHMGNSDAMYAPLKRLTGKIEDLLNAVGLDGTGFVNFWGGVGDDIYAAMTGGDSAFYKGLKDWDNAWRTTLGGFGEAWSDFFGGLGSGLESLVHKEQIERNKLNNEYSFADFQYIIKEKLKEGLSSEDAYNYARTSYISTENAQKWFNDLLDPSLHSWVSDGVYQTEILRQQMINAGTLDTGNSYRDVPLQPSAIPSNVPTDQIAPRVSVYINNEEQEASYVSVTNGKGS
jgi:hypothetical protein